MTATANNIGLSDIRSAAGMYKLNLSRIYDV